mmetsp:Transcript_81700/g.210347  ORF Transcript_81700/g.210347 Transcript_81700/m.210347 type:complete len:367 (-) Transcript_81700:2161-3261(-)
MQSCRRSYGSRWPMAVSQPPSSTGETPVSKTSSSSRTSVGTSWMDRHEGRRMKQNCCGKADSFTIANRCTAEDPTKHRPNCMMLGSKEMLFVVRVPTSSVQTGSTWSTPTMRTGMRKEPVTSLRWGSRYCGFRSRKSDLGLNLIWIACWWLPCTKATVGLICSWPSMDFGLSTSIFIGTDRRLWTTMISRKLWPKMQVFRSYSSFSTQIGTSRQEPRTSTFFSSTYLASPSPLLSMWSFHVVLKLPVATGTKVKLIFVMPCAQNSFLTEVHFTRGTISFSGSAGSSVNAAASAPVFLTERTQVALSPDSTWPKSITGFASASCGVTVKIVFFVVQVKGKSIRPVFARIGNVETMSWLIFGQNQRVM